MATDRAERVLRTVRIAVFAKAPIAGFAKTRLIPALGAQGAARLQRRLTLRTLKVALDARLGSVTVWCAPNAKHLFFRALHATTGVACLAQPAGDLGERMHGAFEQHCTSGPLLLIGTDCPVLMPAHLRAAASALTDGNDAVFFPAEDGGYVLVGLRRPCAAIFTAMVWGGPDVMHETRRRALAAGLRVREFETLWDVDAAADLARLDALAPWPTI